MPAKIPRRRKTKAIQRRAPQQKRARATYDAALEATARNRATRGPGRSQHHRIAERTGISVGTLYGYFPDKTAIVVALARRILAEDNAALVASLDAAGDGDPVRASCAPLMARHRTDPQLRRAVMSVHLGEGHGAEHGIERFVASLAERRDLNAPWRGSPVRRPRGLPSAWRAAWSKKATHSASSRHRTRRRGRAPGRRLSQPSGRAVACFTGRKAKRTPDLGEARDLGEVHDEALVGSRSGTTTRRR